MGGWQTLETIGSMYLAAWTEASASQQRENKNQYMTVFFSITGCACLLIIVRLFVIYLNGLKAAVLIFDKAVDSLIDAPINKFYDVTPSGRIINRLSKDQDKVDQQIYYTIGSAIAIGFVFFMCLGIIVIIDPYVLIIVPFSLGISFKLQQIYMDSARELTRLESISRSPIIQHYSESITGCSTIRAFGHQKRFFAKLLEQIDTNIKCYLSLEGANCWISLNLELVCDVILMVAMGVIVLARGYITAGYAGLTITWGIWMPEVIYWVILLLAYIENSMVSVERLDALIKIPSEAPRTRHKDAILANWPSEGKIQFKNLKMKYRDNTEIVLKGINIIIRPKEKIGIVGRTGSGKSSIGVCLFRIVEALSGSIVIDGVDIAEVGLDILR